MISTIFFISHYEKKNDLNTRYIKHLNLDNVQDIFKTQPDQSANPTTNLTSRRMLYLHG